MGSELRGRYRRQLSAAMAPRSYTKTYKVPRRPFESARLDSELKVVGACGLACPAHPVQDPSCCSSASYSRREGPQASLRRQCPHSPSGACRCARRVPHEARLRLGLEGRGLLGASSADLRLQARSRQVDPPRPCPDPSASHPRRQADRQRSFLHCPSGQPEAHRLRPHLAIWWWPPGPCPEKEGQGC